MSKRIGFMFAGQGAQTVGMGEDLYRNSAAARTLFDQAGKVLERNLSEICFQGPEAALTESENCQPAIYTTSLACLAALQERIALKPVVCGGLSLGEFAALTAAESLSFAAGVQLVAIRGCLMNEACRRSNGGMAAVLNAAPELLESICHEHAIDVANYNCPGQTVISGDQQQLAAAVAALQAAGVKRVITLNVDGAFHSRLMQPAADKFAAVLAATEFASPSCTVVQNVVGAAIAEVDAIRSNLQRQVSGSVRWQQCLEVMLGMELDLLIEFGPGQVLSGFVRRIERNLPTCNVSCWDDLDKVVAAIEA